MIDWPLAVGVVAYVGLCAIVWSIERQVKREHLHTPHRDLVVPVDDSDAGDGHVRHP